MKFDDLQKALNNGFAIRRKSWLISNAALTSNALKFYLPLDKEDYEADDWYIVKDYVDPKFIGDTFDQEKAEKLIEEINLEEPKESSFDFISEVYERDIDIDLLREIEAITILEMLKDPKNSDLAVDFLLNGGNEHLSWRDDLFLQRLEDIYDDNLLEDILDEAEEIMDSEDEE